MSRSKQTSKVKRRRKAVTAGVRSRGERCRLDLSRAPPPPNEAPDLWSPNRDGAIGKRRGVLPQMFLNLPGASAA
jgi:hypothetical protein